MKRPVVRALALGVGGAALLVLALVAGRWGRSPAGMAPDAGGAPAVDAGQPAGWRAQVRWHGQPAVGVLISVAGAGGRGQARSDGDGAFALALPDGHYTLRALLAAEAPAVAALDDVELGGLDGGERVIELARAEWLAGRISDDSGAPVAGAAVAVGESLFAPLPAEATSDGDGRFRVALLPGSYVATVRAEAFLAAPARGLHLPGTAALDFTLARGATITGLVSDGDGRPVAGARVEISGEGLDGAPIAVSLDTRWAPAGATRYEPAGELGVLRGVIPFPPPRPLGPTPASAPAFFTDRAGRFALHGLPAGRLVVAAWHPDYARTASAPVVVAAGASATVQVVLDRGRSLHGRVTDERGDPIAGAEVAADDGRVALSDAHGQYQLAHLHGGALTARRAGFLPATQPLDGDELDFRLARAEGRLGGVVVDERGFSVAGARVEVGARGAVSDHDGRFTLDGLPPGPYHVRVRSDAFAPLETSVEAGDDARLQLVPGGGLDGTIVDARTGHVPAGATVEVALSGGVRTLAVARGRFEASGLEAGRATLRARAPGYVAWSRELEVPAGERPHDLTLRDVRIELERGATLSGQVRDDDGPVAGARVAVGGEITRADGSGQFRLEGLPPGRARVDASDGTRRVGEEIDLRADDETVVELRLR